MNMEKIYKKGLTAKGTDLLSLDELLGLCAFSASLGTQVHTVEAYLIRGDGEIAAPEYSLYGPQEDSESLPWSDQIRMAKRELNRLSDSVRAQEDLIKFQVWLREKP
ncbi:MAG TPA: hypothetical protein VMU59_03800 [Caulobacteraceae bacterium]|nr:hypothetical protein [Caulobacteraceae bacterium]